MGGSLISINKEGVLNGLFHTCIAVVTDEDKKVIKLQANASVNTTLLYDIMIDLQRLFACRPFRYEHSILISEPLYYDEEEKRFYILND